MLVIEKELNQMLTKKLDDYISKNGFELYNYDDLPDEPVDNIFEVLGIKINAGRFDATGVGAWEKAEPIEVFVAENINDCLLSLSDNQLLEVLNDLGLNMNLDNFKAILLKPKNEQDLEVQYAMECWEVLEHLNDQLGEYIGERATEWWNAKVSGRADK